MPTLPFSMRAKSADPSVVCGATPKKVRGGLASESAGASSATDAASAEAEDNEGTVADRQVTYLQ